MALKQLNMTKKMLVGLLLAGSSVAAFADDDYEGRARVISVQPQTQRVNNPRQDCHTEYQRESVYEPRERSLGGSIIGGVAGGLLGSTIGRGNGRVAAAAVGAGIGAIVGDRVDNNQRGGGYQRYENRPVERCVSVDNWQTVNNGYLVQYQYNGRNYSTVMDRDPGNYIPVYVGVRPNGYVSNVTYNVFENDDDDNNDNDRGWDNDRDDGHGRGHGYGHRKHKDNKHGYW